MSKVVEVGCNVHGNTSERGCLKCAFLLGLASGLETNCPKGREQEYFDRIIKILREDKGAVKSVADVAEPAVKRHRESVIE